ncbi:MAG: Rab family GTPase, partial [Candidatus Odinarchaeota archaeon]
MASYDYTFKILLLGDASVGKTSFTKRYCYNIFNPSERLTIGVDFHVKTIELNNERIKLQLWDVGGEERFRFLLPTYCLGANAAFLLYDITRPSTLDNISEWITIVR